MHTTRARAFTLASLPLLVVALGSGLVLAAGDPPPAAPAAAPPAEAPQPAPQDTAKQDPTQKDPSKKDKGRDVGHMHNVHQITPTFFRGSQPVTESDFAELAKLGVKVVVSVDGARPQVEWARKHGMRYVHAPMGYDGLSRAEQVLLYKLFTTLEGPFYVHCHHGRHRGPVACSVGLMAQGFTVDQVLADYAHAGVAKKYEGLWAMPLEFAKPTAEELAAAPNEFPEVAPVPDMQGTMVLIDHGWERLGYVREARWQAPPDHPDVSPRHEAVIFAERFRELGRTDAVTKAHADMARWNTQSEEAAWELAKVLEAVPVDALKAEAAYARIEKLCSECHKQFRDTPAGAASR